MFIYKAGVVGAGAMGAGIAQVISFSGLPVVLKDTDEERVKKGIEMVRKVYQGRVDKGKMTSSEMDQKMNLVTGTTSYDDFKDCDLVIEAVFESMKVKQQVFQDLEKVLPETAIMATNTSALSISQIASAVKRSEKVIGLHFFNPAPVMKLVEVIPGLQTSTETVDDTVAFAESLRKMPVRVKECAGFLVNRLLLPYLNEAAYALQEGSAPAEEMDKSLRAFGMPMGPFALLDMLGLDVCAEVSQILYDSFGPRMKAAEILGEMHKAGRLGTKNGIGFYVYDESKKADLKPLVDGIQAKTGVKGTPFSPERLVFQMINEAAYCLEENVASPGDIDLAMLAGTGFPQDKGGPLHLADGIGVDVVLAKLQEFSKTLGPRFWPAPILKRMVAANYLGQKTKKGFFNY
ncbi:MAG TPA: 3-hydroxyacyl-CoA dehydrogenase NAD-binding domain-containing protein [bacterium]|nr:3-hydroxyacyl-CoA dehydrogenase NAD-binding domain-containing protein [bacterium]